jgi:hypothetical protein
MDRQWVSSVLGAAGDEEQRQGGEDNAVEMLAGVEK